MHDIKFQFRIPCFTLDNTLKVKMKIYPANSTSIIASSFAFVALFTEDQCDVSTFAQLLALSAYGSIERLYCSFRVFVDRTIHIGTYDDGWDSKLHLDANMQAFTKSRAAYLEGNNTAGIAALHLPPNYQIAGRRPATGIKCPKFLESSSSYSLPFKNSQENVSSESMFSRNNRSMSANDELPDIAIPNLVETSGHKNEYLVSSYLIENEYLNAEYATNQFHSVFETNPRKGTKQRSKISKASKSPQLAKKTQHRRKYKTNRSRPRGKC